MDDAGRSKKNWWSPGGDSFGQRLVLTVKSGLAVNNAVNNNDLWHS